MLDKERINYLIEDIEYYLKKIEKFRVKRENISNDEKFFAVSMAIFQTLNKTIDLGDEIVKSEKLGYPLEIKDIFAFLENEKIIDKKLMNKMRDLIIMRNKFSHRYEKINKEDTLIFLEEDKKYISDFISQIKKYLRNQKTIN